MFLRTYKYSLLRTVRQKEILFWSILFPILLGTLFKVTFGDAGAKENTFQQIPVAYVEGEQLQQEFKELLKELETENDLVKVNSVNREKAEKMLKEEKVDGIFQNDKEISLIVTEEGISTSILNSIQEQYEQVTGAFSKIAAEHPEKLQALAQSVSKPWNYLKADSITNQEMDMFLDSFYALIAMNCLFACFSGAESAVKFKANLSQLAARRVAASTNRFVIMLSEIAAKITVQTFCTVLGVCYLRYVLNVNLGEQMGRILLVVLVGNVIGVMLGIFVGSIGKVSQTVKEGICVSVSLFSCFLAGLMVVGMYQIVEKFAPVINRINPAALIVKALYSLNIYEGYARYNQCLATLLGIAALLCTASYLLVRRERYASI